jgi:D-glycero-alpha-D-manno-heptose 1-phosphate guanylyltransferase
MQLVILAGGFGTRLKSVLNGLPKPLADINGQPFLKLLFQNWVKNGFDDFVLCLHYEASKIIEFVNQEQKNGVLKKCKVQFSIEPYPMGTGGAISNAVKYLEIENEFLISNADTWLEHDYKQIINSSGNTISITEVENTDRFGRIIINDQNKNIDFFIEKSSSNGPGYINAGFYKLSKTYFNNWDGNAFSIETGLFPILVSEKKLKFVVSKGDFIDIGIPEEYNKFCKRFKVY